MKFTDLTKTAIALPVVAILALSGCGGGGGSTTSMTDGGGGTGGTGGGTGGGEMPTLTPATGLTPSAATSQTAMSAADTLAARLPTASNEFAPLTSVLKRDFNQPRSAAIGGNAYIKTISSDGANGFRVTYVIGEEEGTVHFEAGDYGAGTSSTSYYKEVDGRRYWLGSYTGSMSGAQKNMGSSLYRYFDANIATISTEDGVFRNNYMTYGLRTDADALPAGTAHYGARLTADSYASDAPSINDRTRFWANVRLTVEFGEGSLDGDIRGFRMQEPGQSVVTLPLTVYADISDGRIAGSQFTATWTQVAPGLDAAEVFAGNILGEFYGPNAEEVGAVLNGSNDDEVIAGVIRGVRPTPSVPEGDLVPLSAASRQDLASSMATRSDAAVTAISGDGADGFNVTYSIGSDMHAIQLEAGDFAAHPSFSTSYYDTEGSRAFYLWDATRSFTGHPEFSHFNVSGWTVSNMNADGGATDFHRGYVAYGSPTDASAMPAGTANYAGRMYADRQPPDAPGSRNRGYLRGDLMLSANFDQGTVGGSVDNLRYRPPGGSWVPAQAQSWTIENGSITGNGLSAEFTAAGVYEGDMEGHFFGPDAAEVGGTIQGTGLSDNGVIWGYFGGKKQ